MCVVWSFHVLVQLAFHRYHYQVHVMSHISTDLFAFLVNHSSWNHFCEKEKKSFCCLFSKNWNAKNWNAIECHTTSHQHHKKHKKIQEKRHIHTVKMSIEVHVSPYIQEWMNVVSFAFVLSLAFSFFEITVGTLY